MSRKYLNDKYCIRCGRKTPCPYLRKNYDLLFGKNKNLRVLDIGCGNGRNSKFIKGKGQIVTSLDMVNDYGEKCILGKDKLPVKDKSIDIILCNYLMMFLDEFEREDLISEIKRVAKPNSKIMVELYPAKDSYAKTEEYMLRMQKDIFTKLRWDIIKYAKGKFIAQYVEDNNENT